MDFGNLLNPTASSSKKTPTKPFRTHSVNVTKARSIPANDHPQNVNMKPRASDRLDLNRHVTQGKFAKWDGESSMPVTGNHSWWKGEAAGLQGSIQDQRRARQNKDLDSSAAATNGATNAKTAKKQRQLENELALTRDRFGRESKDALRGGKMDEEKRPNLADALSRKTYDKYDNTRLNMSKQLDVRHQYISDCHDIIHRDWKNRYAMPPQAKDADAVANLLDESGLLATGKNGSGQQQSSTNQHGTTFRVLPPLEAVEKVYHMSRGQASNAGKRFSSVYHKNERSAREGYINNDNAIGRTTPVGERESASGAPKLGCLALATSDAKRTMEDDEKNHQSSHRATYSMARSVSIRNENDATNSNNISNGDNNRDDFLRRQQQKYRPADTSRTSLDDMQRPDRFFVKNGSNYTSGRSGNVDNATKFSSIPASVLNIMPSAGK